MLVLIDIRRIILAAEGSTAHGMSEDETGVEESAVNVDTAGAEERTANVDAETAEEVIMHVDNEERIDATS